MLEKGHKLLISKEKGRAHIEVSRSKNPNMDHILVINSVNTKKYKDVWIIEKDLDGWINEFKKDGYIKIELVQDIKK